MITIRDILWRIINRIDLAVRYIYIFFAVKNADIILTATSAQTNLGDHAISIAENLFFKQSFEEFRVVEIPKELYLKNREIIKRRVPPNAIVSVSGGGFLGDLWMTEETLVRTILNDFKDNKVIIFPQTIFFSTNSDEYINSFAIYKNVKELVVNVRDKNSYNTFIEEFPKHRIHYIPDMVLSLDCQNINKKRSETALICIRNDHENCLKEKDVESLIAVLKTRIRVKEATTIMNHIIPISFRTGFVMKKLKEISSAKLVVTNRLHMMIFAAITATPCIAIDNLSHKVLGVYQWIKPLPYIKLIENINDFQFILDELLKLEKCEYHKEMLDNYYWELQNEFKVKTDVNT